MAPDTRPDDPCSPDPPDDEPGELIDALVAQALDDLDENRLDIEAALHQVAMAVWWISRAGAHGPRPPPAGPARPFESDEPGPSAT